MVVGFLPYRRFPVVHVASEPPHCTAYRGGDDPDDVPAEGSSTLVEFFLRERDGRTLLRVVESGFAQMYGPSDRRARIEDDTAGWTVQLGFAERDAERVPA